MIFKNRVKTVMLMAVLTVLFIWIGGNLGGPRGSLIAFMAAAAMNFYSYWFSDKMVLKKYRAAEIIANDHNRLYIIVSALVKKNDLEMPRFFLIPDNSLNALATGRNPKHAAMIIRMLISRVREYSADAGGAALSGKPLGLANALRKLQQGVARQPILGNLEKLLSTHPLMRKESKDWKK